jgi:hypothetical protein
MTQSKQHIEIMNDMEAGNRTCAFYKLKTTFGQILQTTINERGKIIWLPKEVA